MRDFFPLDTDWQSRAKLVQFGHRQDRFTSAPNIVLDLLDLEGPRWTHCSLLWIGNIIGERVQIAISFNPEETKYGFFGRTLRAENFLSALVALSVDPLRRCGQGRNAPPNLKKSFTSDRCRNSAT
jgi:hypothetical protein